MILLVTSSDRASEFAAALRESTGEEIAVAESLARAAAILRAEGCLAVVLDQHILETEPHEAETTLEHLGPAILVQVNLAISGMERLVREVRAAMQRRWREEVGARQLAIDRLRSELSGTVTALLLSSGLALEASGLPEAAVEKLLLVHKLVKKLRRQLENASVAEEAEQAIGP
jgi:hypothetical protein